MSNSRTLASTINSSSQIVVPSGGIQFADATNSNTVDNQSNLIEQDGYEEGTFLPVYKATGTDPTVGDFTLRNGFYIKIGKLVHINLRIRGEILSVGTGNVLLGGLPFTVDSTTGSITAFAVGYYESWTTNGPTIAQGDTGTTDIALYRDNGASGTRITVSNYKTGNASYNEVYIAGTYITN